MIKKQWYCGMAFLAGATWSLCNQQSQEASHLNLALGFLVVGGALIGMVRHNQLGVRSAREAAADSDSEEEYVKVENDWEGVMVMA